MLGSLKRWAAVLILMVMTAGPALAVQPGEELADPALEARARALSQELRCLVCQNESIDDSNAPLAGDLRRLVRERLAAGDSDDEVLDYIVARYGEFVLLRPRMSPLTWVLWFGPFVVVLVGAVAIALYVRNRSAAPVAAPLNADEERRLREIVND